MQTDSVVSEMEFALVVADAEPIKVGAHLRYDAHDPFAVPRLNVPAGLSLEGFRARLVGALPA